MHLRTIKARIDKKGRIYLPSKIRSTAFFKAISFRLVPITRSSTKQIERGLLLMHPIDELEVDYFWGVYDNKERYTVEYDPRGRLTTTENIMKDLGLHPFAYKHIYLTESCFGWELWPEHRFKRILRTIRAYKIRIIHEDALMNLPTGLWVEAFCNEKFLFSKESGKGSLLRAINKAMKIKKEKNMFLLEKINEVRIFTGGTLADVKKEIASFIKSPGLKFAISFLDTETRMVPSGMIKLSYWQAPNILNMAIQRMRDLSGAEISERVASQQSEFSYKNIKKFIGRDQLLVKKQGLDYSEVEYKFSPTHNSQEKLKGNSFCSFELIKKKSDVFFNEKSRLNIKMDFYSHQD